MNIRHLLIICLMFFVSGSVFAQGPEFLFTWSADTIVPEWYEGKAFPSYGSTLTASFEIIEQNGSNKGKLVDLSNKEIRWYVGGDLARTGVGLQSLRIRNEDYPGKDISVRVSIPEYYDAELGRAYEASHYESIPILSPRVVGDYYQFDNKVLPGERVLLSVHPFFFNASKESMKVTWKIGNEEIAVDPTEKYSLYINIPQEVQRGNAFPVEVSVGQVGKLFSSATFFEQFLVE